MVHRVYICSDLNTQSIMQQYDQVGSDNNTNPIMSSYSSLVFKKNVHFQEGGHCWLLLRISSIMTWFAFKKERMIRSCTCLLHRVPTFECPHVLHLSRLW
jgi:hypothetical protein